MAMNITSWVNRDGDQVHINNIIMDVTVEVWAVYDTETNQFWVTPHGKWNWTQSRHAKNAVNANPPQWMLDGSFRGYPNFTEQTRLMAVKIGEYKFERTL